VKSSSISCLLKESPLLKGARGMFFELLYD
jgi:hypothetical protein